MTMPGLAAGIDPVNATIAAMRASGLKDFDIAAVPAAAAGRLCHALRPDVVDQRLVASLVAQGKIGGSIPREPGADIAPRSAG